MRTNLQSSQKMLKCIDKQVGENLRKLRSIKGLSIENLAKKTSISFQQIQKYETGQNRLSASRIYELAQALQVNIYDFFDGLDNDNDNRSSLISHRLDEIELFKAYEKISCPEKRDIILKFIKFYTKHF